MFSNFGTEKTYYKNYDFDIWVDMPKSSASEKSWPTPLDTPPLTPNSKFEQTPKSRLPQQTPKSTPVTPKSAPITQGIAPLTPQSAPQTPNSAPLTPRSAPQTPKPSLQTSKKSQKSKATSTPKSKSLEKWRTSTPIPELSKENLKENIPKDAYDVWRDYLHKTPRKMKIRGALFPNEEFTSGHIVMKQDEKLEYIQAHHYMPELNKCFVNLLINGPPPLVCEAHGNIDYKMSKCNCLPSCNCANNLAKNSHLPIGYKYDDDGLVVPTTPSIGHCNNYRDPKCIYTI